MNANKGNGFGIKNSKIKAFHILNAVEPHELFVRFVTKLDV